jgi:3-isopropylmalate/(R)-2-methylmalate dehydratase large subunit
LSHPPRTLFQKIWDSHVVVQEPECPAVLYIDLHLVHEVTSPQAFTGLKTKNIPVHRPDRTVATVDHGIPTRVAPSGSPAGRLTYADDLSRKQIEMLEDNARDFGITLNGINSPSQGIVHIIGPEQGLTRPGMTIVCGDSHTATHGAFGALAFGIGTSEVEHVLATQCLLQNLPKTLEVNIHGRLMEGVTSKDIILALIAQIGVSGGQGYVIEYRGDAIHNLSMEERMTICNMSIEGGARAGLIAPDEVTYEYLSHTPFGKDHAAFDAAVENWKKLPTDDGASYDKSVTLDASKLEPMITFGTNPGMGIPIGGKVPRPQNISDTAERSTLEKALSYMDLRPGEPLLGHPIDVVFVGSCTNGRISDLRQAAGILKGHRVAPNVRMLVVPGSQQVKRQAEAEGLDHIFIEAGAEWRDPGCSMCIAMNGDQLNPGQYCVSTSNRNFEGRQGKGGRTFLASPLTAAASAVTGKITDNRKLG